MMTMNKKFMMAIALCFSVSAFGMDEDKKNSWFKSFKETVTPYVNVPQWKTENKLFVTSLFSAILAVKIPSIVKDSKNSSIAQYSAWALASGSLVTGLQIKFAPNLFSKTLDEKSGQPKIVGKFDPTGKDQNNNDNN